MRIIQKIVFLCRKGKIGDVSNHQFIFILVLFILVPMLGMIANVSLVMYLILVFKMINSKILDATNINVLIIKSKLFYLVKLMIVTLLLISVLLLQKAYLSSMELLLCQMTGIIFVIRNLEFALNFVAKMDIAYKILATVKKIMEDMLAIFNVKE